MTSVISNTILGTTLFLFFLLPGFILLRAFWQSDKGNLQSNNIYVYLIWGTPISGLLYFALTTPFNYISNNLLHYPAIQLNNIVSSLLQKDTSNNTDNSFDIRVIVIFLISINLIAYLIGRTFRILILKYYLDLRFSILKFRNEWFYILTARIAQYEERVKARKAKKEGTVYIPQEYIVEVDFLCEIGKTIIFYKGYVVDFKLKDESLEYIYLRSTQRTLIETEIETTKSLSQYSIKLSIPPMGNDEVFEINGIVQEEQPKENELEAVENTEQVPLAKDDHEVFVSPESQNGLFSGENILDDPINAKKFYDISGALMIFKFSEIKNINVKYKRELPRTSQA